MYGLLGLTLFVRMFGAFGGPLQSDRFVEVRTRDGSVYVGDQVEADAPDVRLVSGELGEVTVDVSGLSEAVREALERGEVAPVEGTLEFTDDYLFIVEAVGVGRIEIDGFDVETDLAVGEPFGARGFVGEIVAGDGVEFGAGRGVRLITIERGVVDIPASAIGDRDADIDRVVVRAHRFELSDGREVRGLIASMDEATIEVRTSDGERVRFDRGEIAAYSSRRAIGLGDEDSPLHLRFPLGPSVLAGGLTLMLVILPIVIIVSQEAIRAVPPTLREASLALGATKLQTVGGVVLPRALPGVLTGAILAMSRAIGETAPILVVGAASFVAAAPGGLMDPYSAMPLRIYQWTILPEGRGFQPLAAAGILVLLAVLLVFNATAIVLRQRLEKTR